MAAIKAEQSPLVQHAAELAQSLADDDDQQETVALTLPQQFRRLGPDWQRPGPPDSVPLTPAEPAETQDYIEFSWAGEDARLTGNLVHRLLQLIGERGLESWRTSGGMKQRESWCREQLTREGVKAKKADRIIVRATKAINNCLESRRGQWILDQHQDSHSEYALTAVLDGQTRNLVLDRSFIENDCRWIIDYKTSSHGGGDLEAFLENEVERYREQLERYRSAVAMTETRPIRTALYFPLLDRFCEVKTEG